MIHMLDNITLKYSNFRRQINLWSSKSVPKEMGYNDKHVQVNYNIFKQHHKSDWKSSSLWQERLCWQIYSSVSLFMIDDKSVHIIVYIFLSNYFLLP